MQKINILIKKIRKKQNLSQRTFAKNSGISFRHLQRLEKGESDITLKNLLNILHKNQLDLELVCKEPKWNILYNFGLPVNIKRKSQKKYSYRETLQNIILAIHFLLNNKLSKLPSSS